MTKLITRYKLTDAHNRTYGDTQWGPGVTHTALGTGDLCTAGWIHVYTNPLLAVLLDSIHGDFLKGKGAHLWVCHVSGAHCDDHGSKEGWQSVTTVKRIALPRLSRGARIRFVILCVWPNYSKKAWRSWARGWLSGRERSRKAAVKAIEAVEKAADRAAWAAWAARAARAAWAAWAARAARAARAAVEAARAAVEPACVMLASLPCSRAALEADKPINLIALARKAVRDEAAYQARRKEQRA